MKDFTTSLLKNQEGQSTVQERHTPSKPLRVSNSAGNHERQRELSDGGKLQLKCWLKLHGV